MDGRLGNGMALWLGGALLAHAALLALPTERPTAGGSVATVGLDVRLLQKTASVPKTASLPAAEADPISGAAAGETVSPPIPRLEAAQTGAAPAAVQDAAAPGPTPRAVEQVTAPAPKREAGPTSTPAKTAKTAKAGPGPGPRPGPGPALSAQGKTPDTFPGAATALTGRQTIPAAARQTSVATPTLDDPAQNPAGAADERDHLRLLELTDRLHQAIERQKRYPLSAHRLGREGTASVAFRLRPDGAIDDLEVAASSGEPALDRAAMRAVSGISPFGEARAYLDTSAPFRVDIAFRLH